MTISRAAAALTIVALTAGIAPAAGAQQPSDPAAVSAAAQAKADSVRARRDEIIRRREALRQRQDELRRRRQAARRGPMAWEFFTWVGKIGRQGTLDLVNASGSVTITSGGGDDVRIEATKRVWESTDAAAKAALSEVRIDVTERADAVDVRAGFPRRNQLDAEVDFTITVPSGANVSVRSGSGDVSVTGVRGELRAEAVSGAITATSVGQVRSLRTLSGTVQLENADSSDITVSTLGGAVTIRQLRTRSADLRTIGGDLSVSDSDAERLSAQSLTGRIELAGRLARTGRYSLQSQSGDVRLSLSDDDFELEAATVNGTVRSEFPITAGDRRETAAGPGRVGRGGRGGRGGALLLRGLSGDGGPLVTLRSFSGDISIARR